MNKFRPDNTNGFTTEELEILNEAFDIIKNDYAESWGLGDSTICDVLNDNFKPGCTVDDLLLKF